MLWNYQIVKCTIYDRVTCFTLRYWRVHIEIPLPHGLRMMEEHWVMVQPLSDSRQLIVNEMGKYFGLAALDMVVTQYQRRKYILIRSSNPNVHPEMTLRVYTQAKTSNEGNRTDMLVERVQNIYAFRRLMCICDSSESSILVRKCGKSGKTILYSLINKFDDDNSVEITTSVLERWFVNKETEQHISLARVMSRLTGVEYPVNEDDLDRYMNEVDGIIEHMDSVVSQMDASAIKYVSDVYHYLASAQQSPMGRKRGMVRSKE